MRIPLILRAGTWLVAVFALVLAACDQGTVVGPHGASSPDAPAGPSFSQNGVPAVSQLGVDPSAIPQTDGQPLRAAKASSATATVFSTIGSLPDWPVSIGYQATRTFESGDFVRTSQPGVLSAVQVGMSSFACQNGGWNTGDCESSNGATFNHPITLNIYGVDYSSIDPSPGNLIVSKEVSFDIPFRPSADPDACGPDDSNTLRDESGRFFDDRLGLCVFALNTVITFDFSGSDVVVPSEFMYGIEFNTQSAGPEPIGSPGPYNSLNFGFIDKTVSSVLVGEDVEDGDLLWEADGVPFDLYDFGDLAVWPFTGAVQFDVTLEGHVTGGGWFTSQSGAFLPNVIGPSDIETDLADLETGEWILLVEGGSADPMFADGSLVSGPGTPPAGDGSARLSVTDASTGLAFLTPMEAVSFAEVTKLAYSTYRTSGSSSVLAIALQFNVDYDLTDTNDSWQGRLVFEPGIDAYTVVDGSWQRWDALTGARWWSTGAPGNSLCTQASPCTWSQVVTNFPNAGVHPTFGAMLFKAGSGWASFDGNVDALTIGINGESRTLDFEPTDEDLTGRASFGFVSRYKKGADVPTGNTQFTFKAGDLNFHSTAYDWLVVNQGGSNAQFKGTGTINNMPSPTGDDFQFMIWAGDGDPDTFRIKIWYEQGGLEQVVYDNGFDQPIEGGQIVVHDGKGKN